MKHLCSAMLAVAVAFAVPALGQPPVRDFAKFADFSSVKLSPNGHYVATTKQVDDTWVLGFIRLADKTLTGGLNFGGYDHIVDYHWVGPERVVVSMGTNVSYFEKPRSTGELRGVDVDGKRSNYLFGWRGKAASNTRITAYNTYMDAWARIVDPLPRDPEWALIRVQSFGKDVASHELYRLNVVTGERRRELVAPAEHIEYYLTDTAGRVRYAAGEDQKTFKWRSFVRNNDDTWAPVGQGDLAKAEMLPANFSADENAAYFYSNELDGDRLCLVRQDLATGLRKPAACDAHQSLGDTIDSPDGSRPLAAVFSAGRPEIRILEPESPHGKLLNTLVNTFPDKSLGQFSWSLDGGKLLFLAYSDRDPGTYYLLDVAKGKLKSVLVRRPWIKAEEMGERRPVAFKARDGRPMHGFLTVPPGREAKNLPLVVHPHGGPFGVRDDWGWDTEAQLLASRGYAVLQVNFRGSGGYGAAHLASGKKNLGADMINDITDGLRHVVQQGYVDAQRVCIYGGSYGGYAALMSAVREPDLYKCAVTFAGIYDMPSHRRTTDVTETRHGHDFWEEFKADSSTLERDHSPSTHIDKLKAAVLIVHGEEDKRVTFSQAKQLRSALESRKHPYEWLSKAREEHGFYNEDNRVEFYEKMLAFLDKHIGTPASPVPTQ